MSIHKSLFDRLNTLTDVQSHVASLPTEDGEDASFELKGADNSSRFTTHSKKKLGKEICAFANTYGGLMCFHNGDDGDGAVLEPFANSAANDIHVQIESWLNECIKPTIYGLIAKLVDGLVLILVPESKNKPHQYKDIYYHRQTRNALAMPEVMVSALYRSQDYLEFDYDFKFMFKNARSIEVITTIENRSGVSGTYPQIQLRFINLSFSPNLGEVYETPLTKKIDQSEDMCLSEESEGDYIFTSNNLAQCILYPNGTLSHRAFSHITWPTLPSFPSSFTMVVRSQCAFLERSALKKMHLFKVNAYDVKLISKDTTQIIDYMNRNKGPS